MSEAREKHILDRLRPHGLTGELPICGFYHPDDHKILRELETRGLIKLWAAEGRERGTLLCRLRTAAPATATNTGGGAA